MHWLTLYTCLVGSGLVRRVVSELWLSEDIQLILETYTGLTIHATFIREKILWERRNEKILIRGRPILQTI